ncbi:MGH1-like glycoside hydrolase domain-containing protein [Pedobacter sp.]|uniref:MGH1-like glycoside hydrolase domain-containing protein n=1 Tax=Pedobacter sp. TaxID=1411316 RepID=UPI003BA86163
MKAKVLVLLAGIFLQNHPTRGQQAVSYPMLESLSRSHDIGLGDWGPYSKKYAGISHIPDMASGMRFDFFVAPGYYRNKVLIPNVNFESGYFPWHADSRQGSYSYRYELEWKDRVYVDVNYQLIGKDKVLATIKCVNKTLLPQSIALNLMGNMNYPDLWPKQKLEKSQDCIWINAVDYKNISFANAQPKDNLVTDGLMNGEVRGEDFLDGSALGKRFVQTKGNQVSYQIPAQIKKGFVRLFFIGPAGTSSSIDAQGMINQELLLKGTGKINSVEVPFDAKSGAELVLKSLKGDGIEINGLLFSELKGADFSLVDNQKAFTPEIKAKPEKRQLVLRYRDAAGYYGIAWEDALFKIREIRNDELDVYFRKVVHNHVDSILRGNYQGHYENVFIRPIVLAPGSEKTLRCLITSGTNLSKVNSSLDSLSLIKFKPGVLTSVPSYLPSGKKYAFSQKMIQAALQENIVYPIYTQRNYIRHYTPGKWWNSLYTWDSGFIALGLNESDINSAIQCINAYTTEVGSQSAFIHHGSPVPVQVYAFLDLLNKTQSKELRDYFYPRLKQYYSFLSGKLGSSSTRKLKSGLLSTWDYFYNSGGWDDYPAQVGVHAQKLEHSVSPVITTSQCIRFAKILRMIAKKNGHDADIPLYDEDIKAFSQSLQKYSWNEASGYFSYTRHDSSGMPIGPFKYKDGTDFNMGMDGAYPILAGICSPKQQSVLLEKLFSSNHMWTPYGMGVVDRSAPYYLKDGYWNGAVWMPHQWFIWKTMLDLGKPELAMQISKTGLEVFRNETENSYYTFEHYLSQSGRGAGWHQFSGLSTPVMSWYNANYKLGTVTTGFEILLEKSIFNKSFSTYQAQLSFDESTPAHVRSLLVCLNPSYSYRALFNGKPIKLIQPYPGLLQLNLPATNQAGSLVIQRM